MASELSPRKCRSNVMARYRSDMADVASDESAVLEVVRQFDEALERRDLDAALATCTADVVFIGSGDGEQAVGRAAIAAMAAELAMRANGVQFTVDTEEVQVSILGDVALLAAFGTAHLRSPRGDRRGPYRLTGCLVRVAGQWRWRLHHGSEPLPW